MQEHELWAVCRESVLALQRARLNLPLYIHLSTVLIEESGQVSFKTVDSEAELEVIYLSPELKEKGVVNEQTCVFGLAAVLWFLSSYKLPADSFPTFSEELEQLLTSMAEANPVVRPSLTSILQLCNARTGLNDLPSQEVCRNIYKDAELTEAFSRNNVWVNESVKQELDTAKANILDSIRSEDTRNNLKPVTASTEVSRPRPVSLHDRLMTEIQNPVKKLRKSSRPKEFDIRTVFLTHPELLQGLKRVTGKPANTATANTSSNSSGSPSGPVMFRQSPGSGFASVGESQATGGHIGLGAPSLPTGSAFHPVAQEPRIPSAFSSPATHFSPIVLTQAPSQVKDGSAQASSGASEKLKPLAVPVSGAAAKSVSPGDKEKALAKKMKELKKNLIKNMAPVNFAMDIEKEVQEEETEGSKAPQQADTKPSQPPPPTTTTGHPLPVAPPAVGVQGQFQTASPQSLLTPPSQFQSVPPSGPTQGQGNLPMPLPAVQMGAGGLFPVSFQMVQDPNTGLYQFVPVAVPVAPGTQGPIQGNTAAPIVPNAPPAPQSSISGPQVGEKPSSAETESSKKSSQEKEKKSSKTKNDSSSKHTSKDQGGGKETEKEKDKDSNSKVRTPRDSSKTRTRDSSQTRLKESSQTRSRDKSKTRETGTSKEKKEDSSVAKASNKSGVSKSKGQAPEPPPKPGGTKSSQSDSKAKTDSKLSPKKTKSSEDVGSSKHKDSSKSASEDKRKALKEKSLSEESGVVTSVTSDEEALAKGVKSKGENLQSGQNLQTGQNDENVVQNGNHKNSQSPQKPIRKGRKSSSEVIPEQKPTCESSAKPQKGILIKNDTEIENNAQSINPLQSATNQNHRKLSKGEVVTSSNGGVPSPVPSPSLSKDSGVSGLYRGFTGDPALMERLLGQDGRQQQVGKVIHLIREEFAFDGYLENGVEDVAMADYVCSLANLKWETFSSAISEKYCDLFWQEDLLTKLYEAVNGKAPNKAQSSANLTSPTARVLSVDVPNGNQSPRTAAMSAFRPVRLGDRERIIPTDHRLLRPRAMRLPYTDTSDSTDTEHYYDRHRRRFRKRHELDKGKSSSMHNLMEEAMAEAAAEGTLVKSHSQTALDGARSDSEASEGRRKRQTTWVLEAPGKPKLIHVKGSESDTDHIEAALSSTLQSVSDSERRKSLSESFKYNSERKDSMKHWESDSSTSVSGSRKRILSQSKVLTREGSVSSVHSDHSAGHRSSEGGATSAAEGWSGSGGDKMKKKANIVYYYADVAGKYNTMVKSIVNELGSAKKEDLMTKMAEIDQQIAYELKMKKKTQKYYSKLLDANKNHKATPEQRTMLTRVSKQIAEMNDKLSLLEEARKHLDMLYAESQGLALNYMYSFAQCSPGTLELQWGPDNPLLQIQVIRDPDGTEQQLVQAGTPLGLMAFLFASTTLSKSYIHHLFYCYRYMVTPAQLLEFITEKLSAATSRPDDENAEKVKRRAIDLLYVWMEGFYNIDFKHEPSVARMLNLVITEQVLPDEPDSDGLLQLIETCRQGRHRDMAVTDALSSEDVELELVHEDESSPTKWEFVKAALSLGPKTPSKPKTGLMACLEKKKKETMGDVYFPAVARKTDAFTLGDYTSQTLAEQLTLVEQTLFQQVHPVHFLNTRAQGIGVSLANGGMITSAASVQRLNLDEVQSSSLFAGSYVQDAVIHTLIEYSQSISYWVAAELVTCSSSKSQIALLSKFIHTAKICHSIRNFATSMAILDGLENLIVRQLPVWRHLPSKSAAIMEELINVKVFLKSDSLCLLQTDEDRQVPTIPCIILFLLHIQQLELGGFTLANGMYKWSKMRSIATVIDQIRIFKKQTYPFEPNRELQESLRNRMLEYSEHDLHALAAQHETNFHKISSGKLQGAFKKMKGKFGSG
ncbi:protein very KIND isoform X2 [Lingula anatina]|nr:protein very KIND isoform X2 [Lingula anatina]XP_023930064.1 protein very KIND isoform X2 [Lingula anatina]|eukprot:XP_023930063.1 protein very KIND isoform X2 [Lingula anatina]